MPLFQARHYEILATRIAPSLSWPDKIHDLARYLAKDNPKFDYVRFVSKATQAWEEKNLPENMIDTVDKNNLQLEYDDEIPQLRIS